MGDDLLKETLQLRTPRLLASGVDYNDIQAVLGRLKRFEDWCAEWAAMAEVHERLGDEALRAGRPLTAGEAFVRAAVYYHTGQSVSFEDPAEKRRIQERQRDAYVKAMPHLRPPARQLEVPFEGIAFTGNLRVPAGAPTPPCVLLNPGADSTKEEFYTLEQEFLRRGVATFSYDGPGQGLTRRHMKLRPDWEKPVGAVIDALASRPEIDGSRLGIWGRSFGGYAAPRAACFERRLRACISIGGFYDLQAIWDRLPVSVKDTLAFGFGLESHAAARSRAADFTLAGLLDNLTCPFLIIHSGRDTVCPVEESERIRAEAGGPTSLVIFPEGNHVCDNIPYKVRPLMADWMAAQLGASG
ncbi:MAG: alpha/beta hydrolase [Candidatus Rokubacteria bacterium]|nr:alpha/beta hydrolase [Candidatus Rokubacteria bacterium]MBI3824397.1 alpha/beta hydrolase [Candidatus Rokubacteria bacterium]